MDLREIIRETRQRNKATRLHVNEVLKNLKDKAKENAQKERRNIESLRKQYLRDFASPYALGGSLDEIADFLGHRNSRSVGIYAKLDLKSLRQVSELDLCGRL